MPPAELIQQLKIAGVALVVISAIAVIGTSQSRFCASCHTVNPNYEQWLKSTHKEVGCLNCHAEPGFYGFLATNTRGAENLVTSVIDKNAKPKASVADASCLKCHHSVTKRAVVNKRKVKVRHQDFVGIRPCTTCHNSTAHSPKAERPYVMNVCLSCHDGKKADNTCDSCHLVDFAFREKIDMDEFKKVRGARIRCVGCHKVETEKRCVDCHGLVLPHDEEFRRKHAMQAEKNIKLCYRCHWESIPEVRNCGCHEEGSIHGKYENWYVRHREVTKRNGMACNCHGGPSFCYRCHDNPEAVWPNSNKFNLRPGTQGTGKIITIEPGS